MSTTWGSQTAQKDRTRPAKRLQAQATAANCCQNNVSISFQFLCCKPRWKKKKTQKTRSPSHPLRHCRAHPLELRKASKTTSHMDSLQRLKLNDCMLSITLRVIIIIYYHDHRALTLFEIKSAPQKTLQNHPASLSC